MSSQEHYFQAVYADFSARISFLAEMLSQHRGEQGRYVEAVVRDLLREFLPQRYALGTGFVVDSFGNVSGQNDIVVYDPEIQLGLFGRTGPLLFPVESVYAVIEVKLTLDSSKLNSALAQVASVKQLQSRASPSVEWRSTEDGGGELVRHGVTPPLGVVLGYRSDTRVVSTLKTRAVRALSRVTDLEHRPDLIVSLSEAFLVRYPDRLHAAQDPQFLFYPAVLRDADGALIRDAASGEWQVVRVDSTVKGVPDHALISLGPRLGTFEYRVCQDDELGFVLADAPRMLLNVLSAIPTLLRLHQLGRPPSEIYLGRFYGEGFVR